MVCQGLHYGEHMGPLSGTRVVEMAGLGAAPMCGMMLADLGAEVLVIQRPGVRPPEAKVHVRHSDPLARGKQGLTLDIKAKGDRELLLEIIACSNVLLESFRPGVMERRGLGPNTCLNRNPALVYARLTGWGQDGPWAQAAGHDPNYIAATGALFHSGRAGSAPMAPPTMMGDAAGAAALTAAISSALIPALQRGQGQVIDAAIAEATLYLSTYAQSFYQAGHLSDEREGDWLDGAAPWNTVYPTSDGKFVAVAAIEASFYRLFLKLLSLDDDPIFADGNQWARERWPGQRTKISEAFSRQDRAFWTQVFAGSDACVSPVLTYGESAEHPQFKARSAHIREGDQTFPAPAPRFSATPFEYRSYQAKEAGPEKLIAMGVPATALQASSLGQDEHDG